MQKILDGNAKIKGLKVDKVGAGDEKVLVLQISIGGLYCGLELLTRLLGAECSDIVREALWYPDGVRHFFGLDPLSSQASFAGCDVNISGVILQNALLSDFKISLQNTYVGVLTFHVTVRDPEEGVGPTLMELLQTSVLIDAIQEPQQDEAKDGQHVLDLARPLYLPAPVVAVEISKEEELPAWVISRLYPLAVLLVREYNVAAASLLASKLRISTAVAEKLLEMMEAQGVVTAANNEGIRTVIDFDGQALPTRIDEICPDCARKKTIDAEQTDPELYCMRWFCPDSNAALSECLAIKADLDTAGSDNSAN